MGLCCPSHHLHTSFASRVQWGCMRCRPPPHIFHVSRLMGVCCPSHHSTHRSRLAFDGGVCVVSHLHTSFASRVRWGCAAPTTTPPIVHVSRSMGECCPNHHLHPSFAQRVQLRFLLVRISRSVRLCRASQYLHPSSASRVRWALMSDECIQQHRRALVSPSGDTKAGRTTRRRCTCS